MRKCPECGEHRPRARGTPVCESCAPRYHRNAGLKRRYGISLTDYERMFTEQDGVCAICHLPNSIASRELCVDHDHVTGRVRGLLCVECNFALGKFKDDTRLLNNAINYLTRHSHG